MPKTSIVPDQRRTNYSPLYDTVVVAADTLTEATIQFFKNTEASSGPQITNLQKANQLQAGDRFTVTSINFELVAPSDINFTALLKKYALRLLINRVNKWQAPISQCPAGGGPNARVATGDDSAVFYEATNGVPSQTAVFMFPAGDDAPVIEGDINFSAELVGAPFTTADDANELFMRVYLHGLYESSIGV